MNSNVFAIAWDMGEYILNYIFDLRLFDVPIALAFLGIIILFANIVTRIVIGILFTIWKEITKKEIECELEEKIFFRSALVLTLVAVLAIVYSQVK